MKVAVFGCAHGMLDRIFHEVYQYEEQNNHIIDLIIICGDCQTLRHEHDLRCVSIPDKYKQVGDFPDYYSGKKKVPRLTIFVGGNHEASNYLMTLPYGGWVCENFYYLGYANVVNYKNLRIAGISGIYNYHSSHKGRFETLPLNDGTKKSIYHTRMLDVLRLQLLQQNVDQNPIDIFLSHDWPAKIYDHGDKKQLIRFKPFFERDMQTRQGLGNPLTQPLVTQLKPNHWFAAHLHCKFTAEAVHDKDLSKSTKFLSLNKIGSGRMFMEILDIEPTNANAETDDEIHFDVEWISILKKTFHLESKSDRNLVYPPISALIPSRADIEHVANLLNDSISNLTIPRNFMMSEPIIYDRANGEPVSCDPYMKTQIPNPQTEEFMRLVGLEPSNKIEISYKDQELEFQRPAKKQAREKVELDEDGCLPFCIDARPNF